MHTMKISSNYVKNLILPVLLFVILLPVSLSINFYQNDDWCYYKTVENFLAGNFTLHPYVGPTLYLQAFMGMIFAKMFGISHLPVLTLLVACCSLYFFILILREFFEASFKWSVVLGLLFFFNLLGVYELWGFMTGQYFELFLLAALYFFLKFEKTQYARNLIIYLLLIFLCLLVRQTALVLPLTAVFYYILKKNFKLALLNGTYFVFLYFVYSKIIPLTPRIIEVPLQFQHYLNFDYSYAVIYGSLLILTAYTLPLVFNALNLHEIIKKKRFVFILIVGAFLLVGLNYLFKPMSVSWGEFPYFENVVERTGFYPRSIDGTKYYFLGNYDLWRFWDGMSKIGLALLVASFIFRFKRYLNIFSIYIVVYLGLMVITETYYDRYIYSIIPLIIFFLLSLNQKMLKPIKFAVLLFVLFLGYLSYLFSADFLMVNKYVWAKSTEITHQNNANPNEIRSTYAWRMTYPNQLGNYKYVFSYDNSDINKEYKNNYRLIEAHPISFPLNIFHKPIIYLYEKI